MFANKSAIATLITSDTKASNEEKQAVLLALNSGCMAEGNARVYSFDEAARLIGKPRKAIYHLIRTGTLKGFYSGKTHARATGVTRESIDAAVKAQKGEA